MGSLGSPDQFSIRQPLLRYGTIENNIWICFHCFIFPPGYIKTSIYLKAPSEIKEELLKGVTFDEYKGVIKSLSCSTCEASDMLA